MRRADLNLRRFVVAYLAREMVEEIAQERIDGAQMESWTDPMDGVRKGFDVGKDSRESSSNSLLCVFSIITQPLQEHRKEVSNFKFNAKFC